MQILSPVRLALAVGLLSASVAGVACLQAAETELPLELIQLPDGFEIALYAEGVKNARSMVRTPGGTLFVGTRSAGNVYAVVDRDGDHRADEVHLIDSGLTMPNGVEFRNGSLYVAEVSRILRYDEIESRLIDPPDPVVVYDDFPTERHHGWKYIAFGPDGKLYVPVGAPCNICESPQDERFASITRMNADGTGLEVYARGARNSVGFDWHPETGELWFSDNGRDHLGDDQPPDELNRVSEAGQHFGYPYCHGESISDPEFGHQRSCSEFVAPAQNLGPHVAALGVDFYTGQMFPEAYRGQIFIAEHGSWNRSVPIGYRVTLARLANPRQVKSYEVFAEGWLQGEDSWGRPVDLLQLPDGSMLLSDDQAGVIYRISYRGD